jgi:hypothetical protein
MHNRLLQTGHQKPQHADSVDSAIEHMRTNKDPAVPQLDVTFANLGASGSCSVSSNFCPPWDADRRQNKQRTVNGGLQRLERERVR